MGFSLRPLGRKLWENATDVFDANSQRDQAKRVAVNQPRYYADQQRQIAANRPQRNNNPNQWAGRQLAPQQDRPRAVWGGNQERSLFSKLYDQANMLDNGRTFKQEDPLNDRSILGQATHNAFTNTVGNVAVKPVQSIPSAFIVEPARSVTASLTGNKAAMAAAERRKTESLDKSLPGFLANQIYNVGAMPVNLTKQSIGDLTNNPIAAKNAQNEYFKNLNATPFGQATNIIQRNAADYGARKSNPNLSKEEQKKIASKALEEIGVDPGASLGKQALDTGLGVAQLAAVTKGADPLKIKTVEAAGRPKVALKGATVPPEVTGLPQTGGKLRWTEKISPDRQIRKLTNAAEEGLNKGIYNASVSNIPVVSQTARLIQGISKELGTPKELLQAKRQLLKGTAEVGKVKGLDVSKMGEALTPESKSRVWSTIDTEQAAKAGKTVDINTLTPEEAAYRQSITEQVAPVTEGNLQRGLITPEQAANPNYMKRAYEEFEGVSNKKAERSTKDGLLKQYKGRKDVSPELIDQAIQDPSYLAGKKMAQSHQAWAHVDYANFLDDNGFTYNQGGRGLVQLPKDKLYGKAAGKWVAKNVSDDFTGFQYTNGVINGFNDIISAYDRLGIRRGKKQLLTVFNPAVRLGNQVSNRVFAVLNGLNPLEFEYNRQLVRGMIKNNDPVYIEAVKQGLTGSDITKADFVQQLSNYIDDPNILKESGNWFQKSYSRADDSARIAAFKTHLDKGYSPSEAARLTQRGFQDYSSVGFFYDMAAKTPIIGNAFVRFAGDSLRIGKNALVDHPLRSIALVQTLGAFNEVMSKLSGETAEDRATRESRYGAPSIPGSKYVNQATKALTGGRAGGDNNISLTTQTPWGEVNVARMMPFYSLNEIKGGISKFAPIQTSPVTRNSEGKWELNGAGLNDPLLGQVAQVAIDKDFMNKSIQDPKNVGQYSEELPQSEKNKNLARFLLTQNAPLGRETDSVASAYGAESKKRVDSGRDALPLGSKAYDITGGKDVYGKTRTIKQSLARAGGIKVEQFGPEQAKETRSINTYYDEKAKLDEELAKMPAGLQEAYKRVTGYYKLRKETPNEFKPGENRNVKTPVYNFPEDKWKDYTANKDLYDMMLKKKEGEAKQGKPLQPEFDNRLSKEFRAQLINNKSLAPGEDVEADERMYSNPEWDLYNKIKDEYTAKAKQYYPEKDGEFVDELVKHKSADFPKKGRAKEAYDNAYKAYSEGKGSKPVYNDAVNADKEAYNEAKRTWTNTERKARGLPPISKEVWDNVTFGFESDEEKVYKELKYGKGYGGYGYGSGGGGSKKAKIEVPNLSKYTVDVGGSAPKAKLSYKKQSHKSKVAAVGGKPKVTIKKSLV